jgi:predicted nucleic-acid-binding protein
MANPSLSLDTSVLLRLLIAQPIDQFRAATQFLQEQKKLHATLHLSDLVLAESYFALHSYYRLSKADALLTLARFTQHSGVTPTPYAQTILSLPNLATANPGFVDRLIHGSSHSAGHTLATFEKSAARLPSTVLLKPSSSLNP